MTIFYLRIVFAQVKCANTSLRICLTNNLFVCANAKKDAETLLYFTYFVPVTVPHVTGLCAASLHDIPLPRCCDLLLPPPPVPPPSYCHVPSRCVLAMFPPPPLVAWDPSDEFEHEILREFAFVDFDFSRLFDFGQVFEGGGGDLSVGSFDSEAVTVNFSNADSSSTP